MIDFLLKLFQENKNDVALVWRDRCYTYGWLLEEINKLTYDIEQENILPGATVALESDFSPYSVAWMLAIIQNKCIYIPLSYAVGPKKEEYLDIAEAEYLISLSDSQQHKIEVKNTRAKHEIYQGLRESKLPGLVLFSSGSTGKSKAAVHDFEALLEKFKTQKQKKTILAFLLFDHIGGVNTMLYALSNLGTLVTIQERSPEAVAAAIEKYNVQILPTSPTFCNLMILRNTPGQFKLKSLELITYGTEVMPEYTLKKINELLPDVKFQQTYGLSEIGIMRSKSEANDSLWVKIGGEGFETRVVDGLLEVRAKSAMKGYLNAPSPFTADGWFKTGDSVELKGEYFKILGRKSELINVGGEKVYPAEVESHLLQMEEVEDVVVFGEKHPILGNIVVAKIKLSPGNSLAEFRPKMRQELSKKVEAFKIPQKIVSTNEELFGARHKRSRSLS